jgi:hypothetical protein
VVSSQGMGKNEEIVIGYEKPRRVMINKVSRLRN